MKVIKSGINFVAASRFRSACQERFCPEMAVILYHAIVAKRESGILPMNASTWREIDYPMSPAVGHCFSMSINGLAERGLLRPKMSKLKHLQVCGTPKSIKRKFQ